MSADWAPPDGELGRHVADKSRGTLEAYRVSPDRVREDAALELDINQGGYRDRQLVELVKNSADAIWSRVRHMGGEVEPADCDCGDDGLESPGRSALPPGCESAASYRGRIEVRLVGDCLYCADNGKPIDRDGVTALMFARIGTRRGTDQIGTFGLGFKSVLGVSDTPEFFSRTGSIRFDRTRSRERVSQVVPDVEECPTLRLPEPIDPAERSGADDVLADLMSWATNIVRLPLKSGAHDDLLSQMRKLRAEFLLFVPHVGKITLIEDSETSKRVLEVEQLDGEYLLADGDETSHWRLFKRTHTLSEDARADRMHGDLRDDVPILWVVPLDRLDRSEGFWAYFPTETASLVPGILNAPWRTDNAWQNLISSPYNDDLIDAAALLMAEKLRELSTTDDPARHLDALPRHRYSGDNGFADRLRIQIFDRLKYSPILPDQAGKLCRSRDLKYPPAQSLCGADMGTEAFDKWAAYGDRPRDWLHHEARRTQRRLSTVARLSHDDATGGGGAVPAARISEWLEALIDAAAPGDRAVASRAAIQIAAVIPSDRRRREDAGRPRGSGSGKIVLTARCTWERPYPDRLELPHDSAVEDAEIALAASVHPELLSDPQTLEALRTLGLTPPSAERRFRRAADAVLRQWWLPRDPERNKRLWESSRCLGTDDALAIIKEYGNWEHALGVRTRSGEWKGIHSVLLPGDIVPGDGSRDDAVTVDLDFHRDDEELLRRLGVVGSPEGDRDLSSEPGFEKHRSGCRDSFRQQASLEHQPKNNRLDFESSSGVGPVAVLADLSAEGKALYTKALLDIDACFALWLMRHELQNPCDCPPLECDPVAIAAIRAHGRIQTPGGTMPFKDALGESPQSSEALEALLHHRNAEQIKRAFELAEPIPEIFGEEDPIPLTEVWPGLESHLRQEQRGLALARCGRIRVLGEQRGSVLHDGTVYIAADTDFDSDRERHLRLAARALPFELSDDEVHRILNYVTPQEIEERRARVRACETDDQRLLEAVGVDTLLGGLPESLLEVIAPDRGELTDEEVARAAIAVYGTGVLRNFKSSLQGLGAPKQWAGGDGTVEFVRSLGFPDAWAGAPSAKPPSFEEIEGPWTLPRLHYFQKTIVSSLRAMIQGGSESADKRRGFISLPTGSGKTRVAIQAIVGAIRDEELDGPILWVAHRGELCEQAVEAWKQVWASIGRDGVRLGISRLWRGQPLPQTVDLPHVIVATVQTLRSRARAGEEANSFLGNVPLVVVDEAHRSIAPEYTMVFDAIGLTQPRGYSESRLLGLSATPYRGYNTEESEQLAHRFDRNRLDRGAFESDEAEHVVPDAELVVRELQSRDILAAADHEIIEGGTYELGDSEIEMCRRFVRDEGDAYGPVEGIDLDDPDTLRQLLAFLPPTLERRIAGDAARTRRIVDRCARLEESWPFLVFAASVEHAQTVAAALDLKGIPARSVSSETRLADRNQAIKGFRRGDVRALVNYNVFAEGFDAPKTQAIVVARPVSTPNLYFQMIGRGLRGKENGGTERCLIINVQDKFGRDNLERFGYSLAFSELDWLWSR